MSTEFKKILIIEDNAADIRFIKELLSGSINGKIKLFYASNLKDGINLVLSQNFDVLLLDLSLPDSSGMDTLIKVNKKVPQIPIIIITGFEDEQMIKDTLNKGAQDYLIKSQFDRNLLIHTIKYAIERKEFEKTTIANEEKYRSLFDNTVVGIYQTTIDGKYVNVNSALVKIFGYDSKEEMMKLNIPKQIYKSEKDRPSPDKRNKPFVVELKKKDGSFIWAEINTITVFDDGKPKYYQGIIRDITDRVNAEKNLKQSYDKLAQTLNQSIDTLSSIVEIKDSYTAGHQKNVARIAIEIAKELGLSDEDIYGLNIASLLHDIGKFSTPASILAKPAKLSDLEFSMVKVHPQTGYEIIKKIDFNYPVSEIILQHHERLDGSGYPYGLQDKDICLGAKILAVADVVEAISSHRPYRPALGMEKAIEELKKNKGILYDRRVVDAFLNITLDFEKIKPGEHFCAFYSNPANQLSFVIPYIIGGLKNNFKCFYILNENTKESMEKSFRSADFDISTHIKSKQLLLFTKEDAYLKNGSFKADEIINIIKEIENQALKEGYAGIRAACESTWISDFDNLEEFIKYENLLNDYYPKSKASGICQYNQENIDENILIDIIATHPKVIINGLIYKNNYYLPPDKFNKTSRNELKKNDFNILKNDIIKKLIS